MTATEHVLGPHPDPEKAKLGWLLCACGSAPMTIVDPVCPKTPGLVMWKHKTDFSKDLPARLDNITAVTEAWVAQRSMMRTYSPVWTGTARVESLPGQPERFGGYYCQVMHAHDGTGTLLWIDYHGAKVHWFRYGCDHEYRSIGQQECRERGIYHGGNCYSVSECKKCGHIYAVDSSD